ncbi:squalene/phytoene synthase family protein [Sphingomonas sp. 1P06PA]|uniref:squalene/phytoene synthase family protein n=1 Tax=Sphingomonas sp. 1P06PA TaxID=554121 RepID=UPI0039A5FAF3
MSEPQLDDPERALVLAYVPAEVRPALTTLWRLDERLGRVLRTTSEPRIGQIRLAWWREALNRLDVAPPPAEPLLAEVAATVLVRGIAGSALADLADGWVPLLASPVDDEALALHAVERGGRLFALAQTLLGIDDDPAVDRAGEGWALVDLARRSDDPALASRALAMARQRLAGKRRWRPAERPLGMLAVLAARDAQRGVSRQGSPGRLARMLWMRLRGR